MSFFKTRINILFILFLLVGLHAKGQKFQRGDTLLTGEDLNAVVVTATKSSRKLADVPMPVNIIGKAEIESSGSNRLDEILSEQTGLSIVNDHGFGVQMQGLGPEYTLILINGEPIIGRIAGTLDLKRISLNDVQRIEILKGPSSSLYGSDALAGVINIITKKGRKKNLRIRSQYGSYSAFDNTITGTLGLKNKGAVSLSVNRYSTAGYDLLPHKYGKTVNPYVDYTFRGNLHYQITPQLKLQLRGHYFTQTQDNDYLVNTVKDSVVVQGDGKEQDYRIAPVFTYKFSPDWKLKLRSYWSQYKAGQDLSDIKEDTSYEHTYFHQSLWKEELQSQNILNQYQVLTTGIGFVYQKLDASRYQGMKERTDYYLYGQHEWHPTANWNILTGLRLDASSDYDPQLSPKIAAQYNLDRHWKFRASVGMGYKAPGFRQLYLDFTNNEVGYTVLGAKVMKEAIAKMGERGQIAKTDTAKLNTNLKPETSIAYNLGVTYQATAGWKVNANLFRNDIKNLIDTRVVAMKSDGAPLFGYHNIRRVYTEGLELGASVPLFNHKMRVSLGYQFLIAKDKDVIDSIQKGKVFKWVGSGVDRVSKPINESDYGGLFNRSQNTFNLKVYYSYNSWSINSRLIYRGRFGFMDTNGNLVLDEGDKYAPGYALVHLDIAKELCSGKLKIEGGVKDLFDYTDPKHLPYIPGRNFYISATFHLF
ncbi:MAG TPA: TonB-dependent receptor [Chitinophagaceae bacterium]|nr:TonB-dependent receptor [Chitinophagaceae bacterium]